MKTTYAVVWREGANASVAGRLEIAPRGVLLHGGSNGDAVERVIPLESIASIRVGRSAEDRLEGRPTVVLERRGGDPVRISSVVHPGIVSELAERLVRLQLWREGALERAVVVVPLKNGALDRARDLIEAGPPFDCERAGLTRHQVFLLPNEAIFLFESKSGRRSLEEILEEPGIWSSAGAWYEVAAGPPQIAEDAFSWTTTAAAPVSGVGLGL